MRYELAFKYTIGRPGGWNNLLLLAVCSLIPVVGDLVRLGYSVEVTRRLIRDPEMKDYPDFTFDRFVEYLQQGLWPFLVLLIVSTAVSLVVALAGGIPLGITIALDVPIVGVIFLALVSVAASVASVLVMWPAMLHAELTQKLDVNGLRAFVPAFWRILGVKAYLSLIVFWLIAVGVSVAGLLLCVIGVLPAGALIQMAAQHLMVQHYRMYLDAGGTPIGETPPDPLPPPHAAPDMLELD